MNSFMKIVGATALVFGAGLATTASAEPNVLTCGAFAAMNDPDRVIAGHDLLVWINQTENFEATPALEGYVMAVPEQADSTSTTTEAAPGPGWTDQEMKIEIEAHCIHMAPETNVVQSLIDHT